MNPVQLTEARRMRDEGYFAREIAQHLCVPPRDAVWGPLGSLMDNAPAPTVRVPKPEPDMPGVSGSGSAGRGER